MPSCAQEACRAGPAGLAMAHSWILRCPILGLPGEGRCHRVTRVATDPEDTRLTTSGCFQRPPRGVPHRLWGTADSTVVDSEMKGETLSRQSRGPLPKVFWMRSPSNSPPRIPAIASAVPFDSALVGARAPGSWRVTQLSPPRRTPNPWMGPLSPPASGTGVRGLAYEGPRGAALEGLGGGAGAATGAGAGPGVHSAPTTV